MRWRSRAHRPSAGSGSPTRAASADRLLLGAPVVATDAGRIAEYHDALIETFADQWSMTGF